MEGYERLEKLGSGSFGIVWKALKKATGEVVAIKVLRNNVEKLSMKDCLNLIEVKALRQLKHPNIIVLKEVIREYDDLFLVFECMEEGSLRDLLKQKRRIFSDDEVRSFCFQIFKGLAHMHSSGFFHRDLKPDNLLVSKNTIKIADLGCARRTNSSPPYTEVIGTLWYRAPEVLLQYSYAGEAKYDSAVDLWAMGAIMAEFYRSFPLFPGTSTADQVYQICRVLGSPTESDWPQGYELARGFAYKFPKITEPLHLSSIISAAHPDALNLIESLLNWDPSKRPTAFEALQHPFFQSCYGVPAPVPVDGLKRKKEDQAGTIPKKLRRFLNCKKRAIRTIPKESLHIF